MRFYIKYFIYWLTYFALARLVFLVFHHQSRDAAKQGLQEVMWSFVHGMRMDASMAAYLSIVPFILYPFINHAAVGKALRIYHYLILTLVTLAVVTDLGSYKAWGFRLDASILDYLSHPKEAAASTMTAPLGWLGLIFVFFMVTFGYVFRRPSPRRGRAGRGGCAGGRPRGRTW